MEWIKVTARLPEEGQRVIVTRVFKDVDAKLVCSENVRYRSKRFIWSGGEWLNHFDITKEVTHWMPYPTPAKD